MSAALNRNRANGPLRPERCSPHTLISKPFAELNQAHRHACRRAIAAQWRCERPLFAE
jgi:hypothetical protein